jgi:hypothetical protein
MVSGDFTMKINDLFTTKNTKKNLFFSIAFLMILISIAGCGEETVNLTKDQAPPCIRFTQDANRPIAIPARA